MAIKDTPYLNWHRPFDPVETNAMPFYETSDYFGFLLEINAYARGKNPWRAAIVYMSREGIKTEIIGHYSGPKQAKIAAEERLAEKARAILIALNAL